MRHYLATLHKRPEHHKRQFALLVAGSITVLIFVIWALVTFGNGGTMAQANPDNLRAHKEVSPLESLKAGAKDGIDAINESLNSYGQ